MPVQGKITSPFGKRTDPINGAVLYHNGVDIGVPEGTPVRAPYDGVIKAVYYKDAGGNQVILDHPGIGHYNTGYAHLQSLPDSVPGQKVKRGQIIAYSGKTGTHITGPHVHFTMKDPSGNFVDPIKTINSVSDKHTSVLKVAEIILIVLLISLLIYLVVRYRRNQKRL